MNYLNLDKQYLNTSFLDDILSPDFCNNISAFEVLFLEVFFHHIIQIISANKLKSKNNPPPLYQALFIIVFTLILIVLITNTFSLNSNCQRFPLKKLYEVTLHLHLNVFSARFVDDHLIDTIL